MATLTIRNLPDEVRDRLRVRAAQNGRSMEAEVRELLELALEAPADRRTPEEIHQAVLEVQAWARSLPGYDPNVSVVDEFLAEKRAAAAREQQEIDEWVKTHK
jgi:plasmid stability protein